MKYIFIIAAFNAFFFAILLLQKKLKALHDKTLFYWLLYLGTYTGIYGLYYKQLFTDFPILSASFVSLLMLYGPFLYLYVYSLINQPTHIQIRYWLHFLPFVLFNLYLFTISFIPQTNTRIGFDHAESHIGSPLLFDFFLVLVALSGPAYFIMSVRQFKTLDINIFNNFSTSNEINLDWLRKLIYSFGAAWTCLICIAGTHHIFNLFSWIFCTHGLSLTLSVFIILIGYFGLKQKEIFSGYYRDHFVTEPSILKYAGSGLKESEAEEYAKKLVLHMNQKKPYLNPDLNLPQLANDINIPSHYLSQIINTNFGQNFFDFINNYRIQEVKYKIMDPAFQSYSILGIAFDSGFNSKSAFNRVFKKITGDTPSQFKKKNMLISSDNTAKI